MLLDKFWFGLWEYFLCEKNWVRLIWICSWCMWEKFIGICKLYFRDMAKFCGYVHGYICGDGQILWVWNFDLWKILLGMWCWFLENLYGYDFGYVRIYLCMSLWEFLSWSCRNFFLLHGYGKILVVVYRYVKNFGCGKIWWHFGEALIFCCGTLTFLGAWGFFGHVGFGHGNW